MANKWYCRIFGHKLCFQDGRRATKEEVLEADGFRFIVGIPTEELACSTCKRSDDEVYRWGIVHCWLYSIKRWWYADEIWSPTGFWPTVRCYWAHYRRKKE
jgi:hypothetical protein